MLALLCEGSRSAGNQHPKGGSGTHISCHLGGTARIAGSPATQVLLDPHEQNDASCTEPLPPHSSGFWWCLKVQSRTDPYSARSWWQEGLGSSFYLSHLCASRNMPVRHWCWLGQFIIASSHLGLNPALPCRCGIRRTQAQVLVWTMVTEAIFLTGFVVKMQSSLYSPWQYAHAQWLLMTCDSPSPSH